MPQKPSFAIKATNLTLTEEIANSVEKRFASLAKFVTTRNPDQEVRFQVEIGRKNKGKSKADDKFFAELDVLVSGERHRAVAQAARLEDAMDEAKSEMTAHLSRAHERAKTDRRKGERTMKEVARRGSDSPKLPSVAKGADMPTGPRKPKQKPKAKKAAVKRVSPRTKMTNHNTRGSAKRPERMRPVTSDAKKK
jgi:ribosome-associated translation inhibitor RaiA